MANSSLHVIVTFAALFVVCSGLVPDTTTSQSNTSSTLSAVTNPPTTVTSCDCTTPNVTRPSSPPSAPALRNCPDSYVVSAHNASCTCATMDLGSPPGALIWEDPDGEQVEGMMTTTELSLELPFSAVKEEYNRHNYSCRLLHPNATYRVPYTPMIAVKPKVHIEGMKGQYVVNDVVNATCLGEPGVPEVMHIYFSCGTHNDSEETLVNGAPAIQLSFTVTAADNNTQCTCYADNDIVSSDTVVANMNVTVINPVSKGGDDDGLLLPRNDIIIIAACCVAVLAAVIFVVCLCKRQKKCCFEEETCFCL